MSKFYTFRQNNSGGKFIGIVNIVIEANSFDEANNLASKYGIYFDGCNSGIDCNCCGDRWDRILSEKEGCEEPKTQYGIILKGSEKDVFNTYYKNISDAIIPENLDTVIYFLNGTSKTYKLSKFYDKARELVRKETPSIYGFSFAMEWSYPSNVFKCYQDDYDNSCYYDKSGNTKIIRPIKGKDLYVESKFGMIYVSSSDKEELELIRENIINDLKDARETAILTIQPKLKNYHPKISKHLLRNIKHI